MAAATIFIYLLLLGAVTYSGALTVRTLAGLAGYPVSLGGASAVIALVAMLYVAAGGLRAAVWADLIQGSALILGGLVITWFAFRALGDATQATRVADVATGAIETVALAPDAGAMRRFLDLNANRLTMFLPATDQVLPWTALLLGLWIPNFYYWGLNQYITQRTLGSSSLADGQRGIVFAAFMKLILPLGIVIPGIIAFNLYAERMQVEAGRSNAVALAEYAKANPASALVAVQRGAAVEGVPDARWRVVVHADEAAKQRGLAVATPTQVHLTEAEFAAAVPPAFPVFTSGDLAFRHVAPGLAEEIERFNVRQREAAADAGKTTSSVPLIAYQYDTALALLLGGVLPQGVGIVGFVLAALLGAVVSSLAAMLNAASTIFTIDLYQRLLRPQASQAALVSTGRWSVAAFTAVAMLLAPQLGNPAISNSIFTIIQEGQGFVSPGVLAVFAFGLLVRRAPREAGVAGLLTNIVAYGGLKLFAPEVQFLNRMAWCFAAAVLVMLALTLARPLKEPVVFARSTTIALETSRGARTAAIVAVLLTAALYVVFSPLGVAR